MYDQGNAQNIRVSKNSLIVNALGAIDELNSFIGIAASLSGDQGLVRVLQEIQKNLLTIGSITAGSELKFFGSKTKKLEKLIDNLEGKLPPLKNFVVPSGSPVATHLQYARTLARRAERAIVALKTEVKVKPHVLEYMNRLSDALFMLAREENYKLNIKEEIWQGKKK